MRSAFDLWRAWPESDLVVVQGQCTGGCVCEHACGGEVGCSIGLQDVAGLTLPMQSPLPKKQKTKK